MKKLSHLNSDGKPTMVDVSIKKPTFRTATAKSIVVLNTEIMNYLKNDELLLAKGPVFQTAIIAGIMAAKKTGDLIPLCHPIGIENCEITIDVNPENEVVIICKTSLEAKTGVEMEALVGATVAALTIYDMCKAISHDIIIKETRLIEKKGGKSDFKI